MLARLGCLRDEEGLTGWPVSLDVDVRESNRAASLGEGLCLGVGPAVARQTSGAAPRAAFDREEQAPRGEHSARLRHAAVEVGPVGDGRYGTKNRWRAVRAGERL